MTHELEWYLPAALGLAVAVLVWGVACLLERNRKKAEK